MAIDIRIGEQTEVPTAGVRRTVLMTELPGFFSEAFAATMQAIAAQGCHPVGPPFAKYYGVPGDVVDVEGGFPIDRPFTAEGEVSPGVLPGGRTVEATHVGPYDTMADSYAEVDEFIEAHGLVRGDVVWESYLSDPRSEPDPSRWQTRIHWPVSDRSDPSGAEAAEDAAGGDERER